MDHFLYKRHKKASKLCEEEGNQSLSWHMVLLTHIHVALSALSFQLFTQKRSKSSNKEGKETGWMHFDLVE